MGPEGRAPIVGDDSRAAAPEKVYSGNSDLRDNAVQFQGNVKGPVTINQGMFNTFSVPNHDGLGLNHGCQSRLC